MKSGRSWILSLCFILAVLACSAPSLPVLTKAEPTATSRATRTPRPTFTPTPNDTPTPVFSPTPTQTNTPLATNTSPPATATNTRPPTNTPLPRPPTNTPRPPTNTPPPTNTSVPQLQFRGALGDTSASNNCALTAIMGQIVDGSGNAVAGYKFHVSADGFTGGDSNVSLGGFNNAGAPTQNNASFTIASGYPPKPGRWYVAMLDDNGKALSNVLTVTTEADSEEKPCGVKTSKGGGIQVVPVIFRLN